MAVKPLYLLSFFLGMTAACSSAAIPGADDETGSGQAAQIDPPKTAGGNTSCSGSQAACGCKCIDPQTDNQNCGACGHSCGDAGACVKGGCPGELRVRALIDGQSQLVLQGKTVKWHVVRAAAPGLWDGHNDPTTLSGTPWTPTWPNAGDNRDCNCDSQPSPPIPAGLKAIEQTVTLTKVSGRGAVSINEQPSAANGYTLKIDFSDTSSGAAWYEILLAYSAD